jgi:AraC family transcriptional regulator
MLRVAPETLARVTPGIPCGRLAQFTNVADPLFTPLAIGLRRAMLGATTLPLAIETLATAAVERVSALLDSREPRAETLGARPEHRMTSRRLKRILDHFETRLAEEIHLADLASDVGLSEAYLARTFRAATGMTLHAALVERRIARARLLIEAALRRHAPASLADIAAATGFPSHAHMTTAFRRVLGIAPSEWMRIGTAQEPPGRLGQAQRQAKPRHT